MQSTGHAELARPRVPKAMGEDTCLELESYPDATGQIIGTNVVVTSLTGAGPWSIASCLGLKSTVGTWVSQAAAMF